jgi:hypothetical protein
VQYLATNRRRWTVPCGNAHPADILVPMGCSFNTASGRM